MPKTKYKFNPESLSFDKIETTLRKKVIALFPHFLSSLGGAVVLFLLFSFLYDSPEETMLKRERDRLLFQYEVLNEDIEEIRGILKSIQYRDDNIYRTIFEKEPIDESIRNAGIGGENRYSSLKGFPSSKIMLETSKKIDLVTRQLYIQSKSLDEIVNLATNKEAMLSSIPAIQPVLNKDLKQISSFFGTRIDPIYKVRKHHDGIDFSAVTGTSVYASGDGVISEVVRSRIGYGNYIMINHGFSYKTRYAHLSKISVNIGQKVKRGEIIGKVGNTGKSVAPHLHYEVLRFNKAVDPINYYFMDLSPAEYDKMIQLASQGGQSFD